MTAWYASYDKPSVSALSQPLGEPPIGQRPSTGLPRTLPRRVQVNADRWPRQKQSARRDLN